MAFARITKAGDVCTCGRFLAGIVLLYVVAVDAVFVAEIVTYVDRSLIDVHVGTSRAKESGRRSKRAVGLRNEREKILGNSVGARLNLSALRIAQNRGRSVQSLAVAQPFIAGEEICFAVPDGSAEVSAELIAF